MSRFEKSIIEGFAFVFNQSSALKKSPIFEPSLLKRIINYGAFQMSEGVSLVQAAAENQSEVVLYLMENRLLEEEMEDEMNSELPPMMPTLERQDAQIGEVEQALQIARTNGNLDIVQVLLAFK
jgi:hypothetical protein